MRWFGFLLTSLAFAYLLHIIITGDLLSGWQQISIDPGIIGSILLIYLVALILQYLVWACFARIYRKLDWHDVDIFARTIFMRRLPGGFWHWIGRTALYSYDDKLEEHKVVQGNLVEWASQLLSGLLLLAWSIPGIPLLIRITILGVVILVAFRLLRGWHPEGDPFQRILQNALTILGLYSLIWILSIVIFSLVLSMTPSSGISVIKIARIGLTAGLTGVLTIPLPATFGIQEAILTVQLKDLITKEAALLLALLLRAIYILSDFIWGFVGWSASRLILRQRQ